MTNSDTSQIKCLEPIWGSWHVDSLIGMGGFGKVYKIYKDEWGFKYESALKVITIPTKEQLDEAIYLFQGNEASMEAYFDDCIKEIVKEIRFLYTLRGNSHIISYEDHLVQRRYGELKWDILMRMEFAMPINKYLSERNMTRADILRLGIEICTALELFCKRGIMHRDIKEENVFVSKDGNFKIGDFGVARVRTQHGENVSIKGTPQYAAPEVFQGGKYDHRADQYSLGILLYRLLNRGRMPFMPPYPEGIKYKDSEEALGRRLSGEPIPLPQMAGEELGSIILKACRFSIEDRYATPSEMKATLEKYLSELDQDQKNEVVAMTGNKTASAVLEPTMLLFDAEYTVDLARLHADTLSLAEEDHHDFSPKTEVLSVSEVAVATGYYGNVMGNITSGGFAAGAGETCYLSDVSGKGFLHAWRKGSEMPIPLNTDCSWFINIVGDWLYYVNESDYDRIYRMKTDGSCRGRVGDYPVNNLLAAGKLLYYLNTEDRFRIHYMPMDGGASRCLCEDSASDINMIEKHIYYINKSDDCRIYKLDMESGKTVRLSECPADYLNSDGNALYFCRKNENGRIYRLGLEGDNLVPMGNVQAENLNCRNGYLYFRNSRDKLGIYRMDSSDGKVTKIGTHEAESFCLTEKWVFYMKRDEGNALYRMSHEGEGISPVFEEEWIEI